MLYFTVINKQKITKHNFNSLKIITISEYTRIIHIFEQSLSYV